MSYTPQVNDYVTWKNGLEGWIYFVDKEYLTIELFVRPKDPQNYQDCSIHRNERLLLICYKSQWKELVYVTSRKSIFEDNVKHSSCR